VREVQVVLRLAGGIKNVLIHRLRNRHLEQLAERDVRLVIVNLLKELVPRPQEVFDGVHRLVTYPDHRLVQRPGKLQVPNNDVEPALAVWHAAKERISMKIVHSVDVDGAAQKTPQRGHKMRQIVVNGVDVPNDLLRRGQVLQPLQQLPSGVFEPV